MSRPRAHARASIPYVLHYRICSVNAPTPFWYGSYRFFLCVFTVRRMPSIFYWSTFNLVNRFLLLFRMFLLSALSKTLCLLHSYKLSRTRSCYFRILSMICPRAHPSTTLAQWYATIYVCILPPSVLVTPLSLRPLSHNFCKSVIIDKCLIAEEERCGGGCIQSKTEVVTVASGSFRSGKPKGAQMDSQHRLRHNEK